MAILVTKLLLDFGGGAFEHPEHPLNTILPPAMFYDIITVLSV